jgi:hypothetical protein
MTILRVLLAAVIKEYTAANPIHSKLYTFGIRENADIINKHQKGEDESAKTIKNILMQLLVLLNCRHPFSV